MKKAAWLSFGILTLAISALGSPAVAQGNYPARPIRLVIGFAPGGTADSVGRLLAQRLSEQMNTNVIIQNNDGAGSHIAAEIVVKSNPDGYTLLLNTPAQILSPALGEKLGYDVFRDLVPVSNVTTSGPLLLVHPSVPANTPAEFVAHLKANPGKLAYGSSGIGSITHLAPLMFLYVNGVSALHVPYKGGALAQIDLLAGRIQMTMQSVTSALSLVKDKRLKAIAIAALKRSPLLPDVATLAESINPWFEIGSWFGVMVPVNTPPAIVKRLNGEIVRALQDPGMKSQLAQRGLDPIGDSPEEFRSYMRNELERWSKVIKSAGIKPE